MLSYLNNMIYLLTRYFELKPCTDKLCKLVRCEPIILYSLPDKCPGLSIKMCLIHESPMLSTYYETYQGKEIDLLPV
jgi:hypothetical protein